MDFHLLSAISIISFLVIAILHIIFAIGTYDDAVYMKEHKHKGTFLVGPFIWTLAVLVGGIPIVAVYWAIHHSTLRPPPTSESDPLN